MAVVHLELKPCFDYEKSKAKYHLCAAFRLCHDLAMQMAASTHQDLAEDSPDAPITRDNR